MTASQVPARPLLLGGRFELGGTLTNRGRFRVCEGYDTREGRKVVLKMTRSYYGASATSTSCA